ncbi:MAG TPA: type II secretion system F family protein [Mycobacteriales bacterium]|nr:type II secretion system F family protein [Mycobacteriales bacterium]
MGALLGLVLAAGLLLLERAVVGRSVRRVRRIGRVGRRAELLRRAGFSRLRPGHLVAAEVAAGLLGAVLVASVTGASGLAAAGFVLAALVPSALVRRAARQRTADRRALWPEVVDSLASGVRAGLSLPEALAAVGERGPEPLRPAFAAFGADHRASGRTAEALDRLRERLADPVGDRVVETVRLAREVGGTDVGTVLRTLAAFLREDARTRAELEARQSWTVNAARVAVAAPWLVLLLLGSQPETARAYGTGTGTLVLAAGGLACVLAYRAMVRIGRLPAERRVLR